MRMNHACRLLILWLALLMPAVEYVAVGCTVASGSHHEPEPAQHANHSQESGEKRAPETPASGAECPMKVPCTAPALQVAFVVELPTALKADARVYESSAIPLSIERTSLTPPPRVSA